MTKHHKGEARAALLRTSLLYGGALALGALGVQWAEAQLLVRTHPDAVWLSLFGAGFLALGAVAGARLFGRTPPETQARNVKAQASLGLSDRELEVLERLAGGESNKEIARALDISPNTVKTHVAKVFEKLEVGRRTQAVSRARELGLLR